MRMRDVNPEFQQFTVDSRCAPEWVHFGSLPTSCESAWRTSGACYFGFAGNVLKHADVTCLFTISFDRSSDRDGEHASQKSTEPQSSWSYSLPRRFPLTITESASSRLARAPRGRWCRYCSLEDREVVYVVEQPDCVSSLGSRRPQTGVSGSSSNSTSHKARSGRLPDRAHGLTEFLVRPRRT